MLENSHLLDQGMDSLGKAYSLLKKQEHQGHLPITLYSSNEHMNSWQQSHHHGNEG
jgi:hypothetical protein